MSGPRWAGLRAGEIVEVIPPDGVEGRPWPARVVTEQLPNWADGRTTVIIARLDQGGAERYGLPGWTVQTTVFAHQLRRMDNAALVRASRLP